MANVKDNKTKPYAVQITSGVPREIPESMKAKKALAYNQNQLALERTELSKIRTDLAFTNSKLAVDQTHLAYLRTIVSLIGTGATILKALPLFGISTLFTYLLSGFLFIFALYFIYKDITTYPKMKRQLEVMETKANDLAKKAENNIYTISEDIL